MAEQAQPAVRIPGLPPGVATAPLGHRFAAYLIDGLVPGLIAVLAAVLFVQTSVSLSVIGVAATALMLGWVVLVWGMFAIRGAGPGMRLLRLQLVGLANGRPIGWGRFFLRQVILLVLGMTGIGLLLMVIFLAQHPRRQGWHDLAVDSVAIGERRSTPVARGPEAQTRAVPTSSGPPTTVDRPGPGPDRAPLTPPPGARPYAPPGSDRLSPAPFPPPDAPRGVGTPSGPSSDRDSVPPLQPPAGVGGQPRARSFGSSGPSSTRSQPATPTPPGSPTAASSPEVIPGARQSPSQAPATGQSPISALAAGQPWPPVSPAAARSDRPGPGQSGGWRAVLDDGREITIDTLVLLGRNPQPRPGEEFAVLIKVVDATRTVSKSHLELGLNSSGVYVVDRGSTNGSTVTSGSGISRRCAPGDPVQVEPGSVVSFGDHWLEIRRG
jgi:uncharacterized RDD family membrane protein YckC